MKFEEWFVKQHGPRPSEISAPLLEDVILSREASLANDKALLAQIREWEARRTSALYAWQARGPKA